MTNVRVGFPSYEHEATMSGGSWESTYPVGNMTDATEMARVARSTDATTASTQALATLSGERAVRLVGWLFDNPSPSLRVRARALRADDSEKVDTGWVDAFPRVFDSISLPWESPNFWTGRYTADDLAGQRHLIVLDLGQEYWVRKVESQFDDTGNADGHLDVAYHAIARLWEFDFNPRYGASLGLIDRTTVQEADGGAEFFDDRPKKRRWRGEVRVAGREEWMQRVYEHQRAMGVTRPFIWQPEPDQTTDAIRITYLARNRALPEQVYRSFRLYGFSIDVKEAL